MTARRELLTAIEILSRPSIIRALADMPSGQRDAWLDAYVLGKHGASGQLVSNANRRLRLFFETPEKLREAA